ncbi:hypothetical protein CONPUDRAFT_165706 [Coniophora puteana RWD-64-598 SS2]|uniref:Transmembrane protein n=1 Tax=Coniophora puteana (strain RWD-64-598) TaxID=741705 RepID=A0A5M3MRB4_CONPW|nr:uncharacterized protein CONPUDRAFT_165706 [Coniophora puteana RWD-64-598 SS2]EIW81607.1 hypothetical protein CONPUDRAFT_165706 [Coniophora puteana RWD-64-598 SS2]
MALCLRLYKLLGTSLLILMITTEGLLCLRTLALWHQHRAVKVAFVSIYIMACTAATVCITLALTFNLDSVCSTSAKNASSSSAEEQIEKVLMGAFSAIAVFEFAVVCSTLLHGFMNSRARPSSRLSVSLRQGNLLYAVTLFVMSVANAVFFDLPLSDGWTGLLDVFQGVLHGVMASRIILSLRNADSLEETERIPESFGMSGIRTMQFASSAEDDTTRLRSSESTQR